MARQLVTRPDHKDFISESQLPSRPYEVFFDEIVQTLNQFVLGQAVSLPSHTVANVPPAANWTGAIIYVSDETGGAVTAFSDGTSWRRTTDRAVIS